jgi:hypothetical protein
MAQETAALRQAEAEGDKKVVGLSSSVGGPETVKEAGKEAGKEAEVDEVMHFLRFSVKPDSTFAGTILFKFKDADGKPASSYAVQISDTRGTCGRCGEVRWG